MPTPLARPSHEPLRTAVIGVGHLGQHHARLLAGLPGVTLTGVVDTNRARAEEIAAKFDTRVVDTPGELLGQVDAVVVATPTIAHVDVAIPFIEAGVAVLVEKPVAQDLASADRLVAAAAAHDVVVACGHTERFNPAVAVARPFISAPRFVEIHRLGTFPERSLDIDVVFDLMIHDLDLLLAVVGSEVTSVEAVGVNVLTPRTDIANVRLRFESGCIANLTASRISRDRVRKARFFQQASYVSIDYATQDVEMFRLVPGEGRPAIQGGPVEVPRQEPLQRELVDFVEAVRTGRDPEVPLGAGRAALALATRIADAL